MNLPVTASARACVRVCVCVLASLVLGTSLHFDFYSIQQSRTDGCADLRSSALKPQLPVLHQPAGKVFTWNARAFSALCQVSLRELSCYNASLTAPPLQSELPQIAPP